MSGVAETSRDLRSNASAVAGAGSGLTLSSLFILFAVELFVLVAVVWSYLFNRSGFPGYTSDVADPVWGSLAVAAAVWGSWYLVQSRKAALHRNFQHSRNLLMVVVGSGATLLGLLLLNMAAVATPLSVVTDIRAQVTDSADAGPGTESVAVVGNAEDGKKWFLMTCVTCHGPTGDGVPNAAPSLRSSDFLKTTDDQAIAALIRNGRAAADPANKTGKVMPAKGGNPFLIESKIADLVA